MRDVINGYRTSYWKKLGRCLTNSRRALFWVLMSGFAAGKRRCRQSKPGSPIFCTIPVINRLIELEADVCYQQPPTEGEAEFCHTLGNLPILISAPHGAVHTRNGNHKPEDEFTAGIARLVAERSGAHVVWLRRKSSGDANQDCDCPYKDKLEELVRAHSIRCVLDIHGAAACRKFGIALGTSDGKSCKRDTQVLIEKTLSRFDFAQPGCAENKEDWELIKVNDKGFSASGCGTITRYVSRKLPVDAAQLELNAHLRIPRRREDASSEDFFETCNLALVVETVRRLTELVHVLAEALPDTSNGTS